MKKLVIRVVIWISCHTERFFFLFFNQAKFDYLFSRYNFVTEFFHLFIISSFVLLDFQRFITAWFQLLHFTLQRVHPFTLQSYMYRIVTTHFAWIGLFFSFCILNNQKIYLYTGYIREIYIITEIQAVWNMFVNKRINYESFFFNFMSLKSVRTDVCI